MGVGLSLRFVEKGEGNLKDLQLWAYFFRLRAYFFRLRASSFQRSNIAFLKVICTFELGALLFRLCASSILIAHGAYGHCFLRKFGFIMSCSCQKESKWQNTNAMAIFCFQQQGLMNYQSKRMGSSSTVLPN